MFWGGDDSGPNVFLQCSELVRTGKLPEGELCSEMLPITSSAAETERADGMRVCAATRSAQKGGEVWKIVYQQLMMTSKANPAAAPPLVRPKDEIVILDFHVHNADHALGSCLMAAEGGPVQRHVMLKFLRDKKSLSACEFSQKRVGAHLGTKWLKHELKLFTETGKSVAPIEADITILDDNDKAYLRSVPGAMEAYEGTRTWEGKLRVTCLNGAQVSLQPSLKAEFAHALPSVKAQFDAMEKLHNDKYGSLLVGKLQTVRGDARGGTPTADPRPSNLTSGNAQEGSGKSNPEPVSLTGPESDAQLRQQYKINVDVKAFDNRGVGFLVADNGHAFIIVKSEDLILRKGTKIAGLGSGRMTQEAGGHALQLGFPEGDRTLTEAWWVTVWGVCSSHRLLDVTSCISHPQFQVTSSTDKLNCHLRCFHWHLQCADCADSFPLSSHMTHSTNVSTVSSDTFKVGCADISPSCRFHMTRLTDISTVSIGIFKVGCDTKFLRFHVTHSTDISTALIDIFNWHLPPCTFQASFGIQLTLYSFIGHSTDIVHWYIQLTHSRFN